MLLVRQSCSDGPVEELGYSTPTGLRTNDDHDCVMLFRDRGDRTSRVAHAIQHFNR